MLASKAASMIDISAVRTASSLKDIEKNVEYAKEFGFINVHVLPCWVSTLSQMLKDVKDVYVGAPVGFPGGAHRTETKLLEASLLLDDGVEEMDFMMNIGKLKNGEYHYCLDELRQISALANGNAILKVIIEINALTDEEMRMACNLVMDSDAEFIKTGTGWIPGDANIDRIKKIKDQCKDRIKIKAAGGIRTVKEFNALADMGVERMGINTESALSIVKSFK